MQHSNELLSQELVAMASGLKLYPIENPESVNERRLAVGLNTLGERTVELRDQMAREHVPMPPDLEGEYEKWLYSVGWRVAVDAQLIISSDAAR